MGNVYAIVMAGGRGERFWPLSTARRPKQVLRIFGNKSLIEMTCERISGIVPPGRVLVITSDALAGPLSDALPSVPPENVVGEPVGRDTAAAITLGAALVAARDPSAVLCVVTADALIGAEDQFRSTIREAVALAAANDFLITIGIRPSGPSTGFGYIEAGEKVAVRNGVEFVRAARFVEKPDLPTAREYVAGGRFCWNSGMFVWSLDSFRKALRKHRPALAGVMDRIAAAAASPDGFRPAIEREYAALDRISVDYALMEKADNIVMARGEFPWDDVGAWSSLENHFAADKTGNTALGPCESMDSSGNIVVSEGRLTALIGVDDLVVVNAAGATLVCHKSRVQDVKAMVRRLESSGRYGDVL